jgi:hypothetical protein
MVVAPPRADYDYSPLDLAPPGQRRRRQLVAAALGGLVMTLLIAAVVFAYLILRDDSPAEEGGNDIAAAQTEVAGERATVSAKETIIAQAGGDTTTPAAGAGAAPTATAPAGGEAAAPGGTTQVDQAGEQAAVEPTEVAANAGAGTGPTAEDLQALLPAAAIMPSGLDNVTDTTRAKAEVVSALGGGRDAETKLASWGWSGNVERSFTAPDPALLAPDATTDITVSLHGFSSDAAAAEALTFYSDILVAGGYEEVEAGSIGATNRMLVQPQEDGGTTVALYVQQGPVLYRIGGYSPGGDPTANVVNVATAMLSQ